MRAPIRTPIRKAAPTTALKTKHTTSKSQQDISLSSPLLNFSPRGRRTGVRPSGRVELTGEARKAC